MATWVTFSNAKAACHATPYDKYEQAGIAAGLPTEPYPYNGPKKGLPSIVDWHKLSEEQRKQYQDIKDKIFAEEAQQYIDATWPGQGVTVISRQTLPYGSTPAFGSGGQGGHFCYTPAQCAGRSSCPKRYACSE